MKVRLFAGLREAIGDAWIEVDASSVAELRARLAERAPAELIAACAVVVNDERVTGDAALADGDDVAVLPPVAGGSAARLARPDVATGNACD